MPHERTATLEVTDLSKRFGEQPVLTDITFRVEPGSIVHVGGGNGTGKSTLLRCLAGMLRHTGDARLGDERLGAGSIDARRLVGYMPQHVSLLPTATVGETIRFFASLRGVEPAAPLGFLPSYDARVGTLSGGQRQRVALTVSLLGDPPLLLLDEPSSNLDEEGREALRRVLVHRAEAGTIVLIASPVMLRAANGQDRLLRLADGRIASDGPLLHGGGLGDMPPDAVLRAGGGS